MKTQEDAASSVTPEQKKPSWCPEPEDQPKSWCPETPKREKDLGFERQPMVDWFDPRQLAQTGLRTVLSTVFGAFFDKRELEAALNPPLQDPDAHDHFTYDASGGDFWFDYVADTGDGWNPTYTLAWLLAQRQLPLLGQEQSLPRGRLLILGGDQVYPTASRQEYQNRFSGPFRSALPCEAPEAVPDLFALPGNHDWYDGLTSFLRLFCQQRWIGGWRTRQQRSYFAIELKPYNLWIWGIDVQLESDIDKPQLDYFRLVARHIRESGHPKQPRVILCTAEPAWIDAQEGKLEKYSKLKFFEERIIKKEACAELVVTLAGDLHHYCRYEAPATGHQKITSGGGGATLAGTHQLPEKLDPIDKDHIVEEAYERKEGGVFPQAKVSRFLSLGVLKLPFLSRSFSFTLGLLFLLTAWLIQRGTLGQPQDVLTTLAGLAPTFSNLGTALGYILSFAIVSPGAVLVIALIVLGFTAFSAEKWYVGLVHGLVQGLLCLLTIWIFAYLTYLLFPASEAPVWARVLVFSILMSVGAGLLSATVVGVYLWLVHHPPFKLHLNEVFASQSYQDYKNFLRFRVNSEGITLYPIGIKRVIKKWNLNPNAKDGEPWFEPAKGDLKIAHLIEGPIDLPMPGRP